MVVDEGALGGDSDINIDVVGENEDDGGQAGEENINGVDRDVMSSNRGLWLLASISRTLELEN